jgi:hypothetical protein
MVQQAAQTLTRKQLVRWQHRIENYDNIDQAAEATSQICGRTSRDQILVFPARAKSSNSFLYNAAHEDRLRPYKSPHHHLHSGNRDHAWAAPGPQPSL